MVFLARVYGFAYPGLGHNLRAEEKSADVSRYSGGDGDTSSDDHDESNASYS